MAAAEDKTRAIKLNEEWDLVRQTLDRLPAQVWPAGSIGAAYDRALKLRAAERKAKGIEWTTEQHSRDDWPRAWKHIGPGFGNLSPQAVTPEELLALRAKAAAEVSETEAHRVIKVWRALWKKMGAMAMCDPDADPALAFANAAPEGSSDVWFYDEAARLVKRAIRMKYFGLATLLAVAWDTQLSPVDARRLCPSQRRQDARGTWFDVRRAKGGAKAIATLGRRSERLLKWYIAQLPAQPLPDAPIMRNRSGDAYSKDTLGDDFRAVRAAEFGPDEDRTLARFRASGAVEAVAGKADPGGLSKSMGNTIGSSNKLHKTYVPGQVTMARDVDDARVVGRGKLRDQ